MRDSCISLPRSQTVTHPPEDSRKPDLPRTARTRLTSDLPGGVVDLLLFSPSEHGALVVAVGVILEHKLAKACRGILLVIVFRVKVQLFILRWR